jgi:hypothetical protein
MRARIVLEEKRRCATDDDGDNAEDEVGLAPTPNCDEIGRCGRHGERAKADPARRQAGRQSTAFDEPALHRAHGGNVRAADADADAKSVRCVNLCQTLRDAR